jgi:hypothetical protein
MAEKTVPITGGCLCGRARYRMAAEPLIVHACHCTQCQRLTGSAFVVNALIEKDKVALLSGAPTDFRFPGSQHTASFCNACGGYLWSEYGSGFEPCRFVRVGTLDQPDRFQPDVHIYTATKQPWVILPDGVPAFAEFYDRAQLWPATSLERLGAASRPD